MKKYILTIIITAIIFTGVGVLATTAITADSIQYDENTTVKDKIDDLYTLANNPNCVTGTFNCTGGCFTNSGLMVEGIDFNPTYFYANNTASKIIFYNGTTDRNNSYQANFETLGYNNAAIGTYLTFNNGVTVHNFSDTWSGTFYYVACK